MENFYLILIYLGIGLLLRKMPAIPANTGLVLNTYVLYVTMPALILQKVPLLTFSSELLIPTITPWFLLVCVVMLVLAGQKLFGWSREITGALLVILPLGNTSFIGFPMTEVFFGSEGMPYAVIYDQLGSFIALATYATIIAAIYSPQLTNPGPKQILLKILTFPSFIALILGLLLKGTTYPAFMQRVIDDMSATLIPVVMVAIGYSLHFKIDRKEISPLLAGLGIALIIMPCLAWLLWLVFGIEGIAVQVSIFEAATPPMVSAGAVAIMAGLAPRFSNSLVGIGLLLGFISLPVVYWLMQ